VSPSSADTTTPTPVAANLTKFYAQHLSWHACGHGFRCATMTVPLDYSQPAGATLGVAVTMHPATGSRRGALIVNPGGPGASGIDFAQQCYACFGAFTDHYDLASFDPRGVARTRPVRCLTPAELDAFFDLPPYPTTAAQRAELIAGDKKFVQGCLRRNGTYLSHIGTIDSARDMDVFRALLGDAKLTYYGASYGTYLGAKYAQLFPTHIRALVLDGAVDPAQDNLTGAAVQAKGFEVDLADFLRNCAATGACPLGGSAAAARQGFDQLQARIAAHPEQVGSRRLGPAEFIGGVAQGMYAVELWRDLRTALGEAEHGDGSGVLKLFDALVERNKDGSYSNLQEAFNAISCIDRQSPKDLSAYEASVQAHQQESPHFAAPIIYPSYVCALWPVPPVEQAHPVSAPGAPPILVIGTTHDPATPYTWAQALASQLHARLLTREGSGHTAYLSGNDCIVQYVDAYVLSLRLPADGARCS
jgi:pimeloyl-ACP methyl ester carboxylesterase